MENPLSQRIIGAAIEAHRQLGSGLLESAYEECLAYEFGLQGIPFERQKPLPVMYKGIRVECGFRLDFLVDGSVIGGVESRGSFCAHSQGASFDLPEIDRVQIRTTDQFQC